MTRFVLGVAVVLAGASAAPSGIVPRMMTPYRDPPPFAPTYHVALLLPYAGVAGEPAVLAVRSLQSVEVPQPGTGGPCGSIDRFSPPPESAGAAAPGGGTPLWVPVAAGGLVVRGFAALGFWVARRGRAA